MVNELSKADQIVTAFYSALPTGWQARKVGTRVPAVNFHSQTSMVSFTYIIPDDKFIVSFNKFIGAFGDYVLSISRGLHTIMTALQAGGLLIDAPPSYHEVTIQMRLDKTREVVVRYVADEPWLPVIRTPEEMEERPEPDPNQLLLGLPTGTNVLLDPFPQIVASGEVVFDGGDHDFGVPNNDPLSEFNTTAKDI